MRYKKIIPAIPGTTVIHYNGYHDTTQEEPILFWGMGHEENDAIPYVMPFTFDTEGGQSTPFDLPEGGKDGNESCIVAFYIPGWGRLAAFNNSDDWGNFMSQVKGYDPDFGTNSRLETELTAVTEQRDRLVQVIEAATILIAAKGRHNTMLAYNGLRDALQSLTPNDTAHTQKERVRRSENTENK